MRYYALFLATVLLTFTQTAYAEVPAPQPTALEKAHAWVMDFMVKKAPPGRKVFYEHGQETKEEALERYEDIAWDVIELAYSKDTQPVFASEAHGRSQTAAVWLGIMLFESGFTKHVDYNLGKFGRGDGGLSWCMMQMRIGSGKTAPWNVKEDRQPWFGDDPADIFAGYEGPDLIQDRQRCIEEAHHLVRLSFKKCEGLPLLDRLMAYTIGKCAVTKPEDPLDVEYVQAGKQKSQARVGAAVAYFAQTKFSRGFTDQQVVAELEAVKSEISFVGPQEVKGFPMDRALIRRLRTAAARGYTVAHASEYAKALGGDGSETTASALLALALGAKAEAVKAAPAPEAAPVEVVVVEETVVVEKTEPTETAETAETEETEDAEKETEEAPKAFSEMSKSELYEVAQDLDIPGRASMDKKELLAAVVEAAPKS
jgi:hypothetical protein